MEQNRKNLGIGSI